MTSIDLKKSLNNHIKSILSATLEDNDIIGFAIYNCINDKIPTYYNPNFLRQEFLVEVKCRNNFKTQLQNFLKREVYVIELPDYFSIYWFEGDYINYTAEKMSFDEVIENVDSKPTDYIEKLKNYTHLPTWLDSLLFETLGAVYLPDYQKYNLNLDLDASEIKVYLGTYFPRSYSESFCIFDNIFQNKQFKNLAQKKSINILDIGAGTGGDLAGILIAINKYRLSTEIINIYALDGNEEALKVLKKIIIELQFHSKSKIQLTLIPQTINSVVDIDLSVFNFKFDFILSFKMICEIINNGNGQYDNSYYELTKKCLNYLSESGLFVLLDVTTKANQSDIYNPVLMNRQVNNVLSESEKFKSLIPLSCNHYENLCKDGCFTQKVFKITHKQRKENISKVSYRVIGQTEFVNKIIKFNN